MAEVVKLEERVVEEIKEILRKHDCLLVVKEEHSDAWSDADLVVRIVKAQEGQILGLKPGTVLHKN